MAKASDLIIKPATWHIQEFLTSWAFPVPTSVYVVYATGCAGGNGAGNSNDWGGRSGTACYRKPISVTPNSSLNIAIGAGGSGNNTSTGGTGGNTVIGNLILASSPQGSASNTQTNAVLAALGIIYGAEPGGSFGTHTGGNGGVNDGAAGAFGNGGVKGTSGGPHGASASANTGAGGGNGYSTSDSGGNGGSGRVILEWLI